MRLATLLIAATLALPAAARPDDGPGRGRLAPAEREKLKEEVQRKVQTYVTVELSSRLGLDEKRALKMADAVKAHMERRRAARKEMKAEYEKLQQLVDGNADDKAVSAQVKVITEKAGQMERLDALLADTSKFLNAKEQAKLVLAVPHVMKDIGKMMKHGGRGPRGDDDDDD